MEDDEQNGMDPSQAGAYIARLALKKRVKQLYAIRWGCKFFTLLWRSLPVRPINAILYQMYAK